MGRKFRLAVLLLALACAGVHAQQEPGPREVQVGAAQFERGAPLPGWVDALLPIPATQDRTSPSVVLLSDAHLSVRDQGMFSHRALQVNSTTALADLGRDSIGFDPAYQRARLHLLRVHRGGQVIDKLPSAKITFLQRESGLEQGVYSGEIEASILIDDLRVGDVLEIASSVSGANPVFGGKYSMIVGWDRPWRTEMRRISLLVPRDRQVQWKQVGDSPTPLPPPTQRDVGADRQWRWEGRGLPATEMESNLPADANPLRFLQFSEWRDWAEVASWAAGLFEKAPGTPELQALVDEFAKAPTAADRTTAALRWVQGEIRYVSLSLGESSHRPALPALTLQRRYGDCKDKALLLVTLLRKLGIEADPVLLSSQERVGVAARLPSATSFDHVIVRAHVDGRTHYLDATREPQVGKLDTLGQPWVGAEVLVASRATTGIDTVQLVPGTSLPLDEVNERIVVDRLGGGGRLEHRNRVTGTIAESWRATMAQLSPAALERAVLQQFAERYPGATIAAPPKFEVDADNNAATLHATLKVPSIAPAKMGGWVVNYRPENMVGVLRNDAAGTRQQPLALVRPRKLLYTLDLEFPQDVHRTADPSISVVKDPSFNWNVLLGFRGNRAMVRMELDVLSDRVAADRLAAYRDNIRLTELPHAFMIHKYEITPVEESTAATLAPRMRAQYEERARLITRAVDSKRLRSADMISALCERAAAFMVLDRQDKAMADAQAALAINQNNPVAWGCVASVRLHQGQMQEAVRDFTTAITLDPDYTPGYMNRGRARYYLGQYAAAAEDFERAGMKELASGRGAPLYYAELWHLWAQRRAGQPPTAAQEEALAHGPETWPRAALSLFLGKSSVDDMLRSLEDKKGDDRALAQAEAYFFAGQWYLLGGDKARAREYFRKTRDVGAIHFIEHRAAGIELEKLAQP